MHIKLYLTSVTEHPWPFILSMGDVATIVCKRLVSLVTGTSVLIWFNLVEVYIHPLHVWGLPLTTYTKS